MSLSEEEKIHKKYSLWVYKYFIHFLNNLEKITWKNSETSIISKMGIQILGIVGLNKIIYK